MQRSICRAAGRRNDRSGILKRFARDDVARANSFHDQIHDHLAREHAELVANFVRCGGARRIRQRKPDGFRYRGHGVGGKLRAACAGRRAGILFENVEVFVRHLSDRMFADSFVNVLNGDRLALERAWKDRPAVDVDRRHIETAHRHHHAGL